MTNRYTTEAEQAGTIRRQQAYRERKAAKRERLRAAGLREYRIFLTDAEVPSAQRLMARLAEKTTAIGDRPGLVGPVLPRGTSRIVSKPNQQTKAGKKRI